MTDFLTAEGAHEALTQILDQESHFCPLTGERNFLRLPKPIELRPAFYQRQAYNDGGFFRKHSDADAGGPNWQRRLSGVYYVHTQPRKFEGGDLVIYDRRGHAHRVEPEHNSAVFFARDTLHEVLPVSCASRAFEDSRFAVNIWIS